MSNDKVNATFLPHPIDPAEYHLETIEGLRQILATIKRIEPLYPNHPLGAAASQLRFIMQLAEDGGMSTDDAADWLWAARRILARLQSETPTKGETP